MKTKFEDLKGQIITSIEGCVVDSQEIRIKIDTGEILTMRHYQDCCENVSVEQVDGDIKDLIGQEVLIAEERVSDNEKDLEPWESATWTFYVIQTNRGDLTIRWLGSSNGYYSERVSCEWNK